jgi:hypothetical protein
MYKRVMCPLSLQAQRLFLAQCFPEAKSMFRHGVLIWEGLLQPTAVSHTYEIRITYSLSRQPEVRLLAPNPQEMADKAIPGRTLPHIYTSDHPVQLCIYHPKKREWKPNMPLAATIIPWTVMWLSFFEDWVCTDVWSGGGEHPETH